MAEVRQTYERQQALSEAREIERQVYDGLWYDAPPEAREVDRLTGHPDYVAAKAATARLEAEVAALQGELGGTAYRVAAEKLASLGERVEKLNKKASKLGTGEITLTVTDERDEEVRREAMQPGDPGYLGPSDLTGEFAERVYNFIYVILAGETPEVPGYIFLASLDHTAAQGHDSEDVAISRIPAYAFWMRYRRDLTEEKAAEVLEAIDLTRYRHAKNICEHCGFERQRNTTYVFFEEATGTTKQVGSTCLRDYTGANDPHKVAAWAEFLAALDYDLSIGGEEGYGAGAGRVAQPTVGYLAHVAAVIRKNGWRARWIEGTRGYGSADEAHDNIRNYGKTDRGAPIYVEVEEADGELAEAALAWVRDDLGEREDLDEFQHNMVTYTRSDYLPEKGDGVIAYTVMAYRREREREIEAERAKESDFIASVGDRIKLEFTISFVRPTETRYGVSYLTKGATPGGDRVLWWGSRELDQGQTYSASATVKRHEEDSYAAGAKTTVVTNLRGIKPVEAAVSPEVVKTADEREAEAAKRRGAEEKRMARRREEYAAFYVRAGMPRDSFIASITHIERAAYEEAGRPGGDIAEWVLGHREAKAEESELECLDRGDGSCGGAVEHRMALSATGSSFPRCEKHWEARLEQQERISQDYPDSPVAPEWFDPAAAGERWDD